MCGIAVVVTSKYVPLLPNWPCWEGPSKLVTSKSVPSNISAPPSLADILQPLQKRGPDFTQHFSTGIEDFFSIQAIYSVLSLRGPAPNANNPTAQTLHSEASPTFLLFNGEIYDGFGENDEIVSDTDRLRMLLNESLAENKDPLQTLDALRGPWALIFWHQPTKRLYFGRDCLGRRSLLIDVVPGSHVTITSTPPPHLRRSFVELPPHGLAYLDFSHCSLSFGLYPRPVTPVPPVRVQGLPATTVTSGSSAEMYISFLPRHCLRSVHLQRRSSVLSERFVYDVTGQFILMLRYSVRKRLATNMPCAENHERFALLFSGGVDSMVLARLLDLELPPGEPLQLINVAFDDGGGVSQCPDRRTAQAGLHELRKLSKRPVSLVKVDVPAAEADDALCSVRLLLHPCDAPMDSTIGTALWLAARGVGTDADDNTVVVSRARILFSGLGADELLGGYKGRHRTTFRTGGEDALARELDGDLSRIWFRNLGRDDRIISSTGKEIRHPFLDEDFIQFVSKLPLSSVCNLTLPDGVGDKQILRNAAISLGLSLETSQRAKRAIQFGSRGKHVLERKK